MLLQLIKSYTSLSVSVSSRPLFVRVLHCETKIYIRIEISYSESAYLFRYVYNIWKLPSISNYKYAFNPWQINRQTNKQSSYNNTVDAGYKITLSGVEKNVLISDMFL